MRGHIRQRSKDSWELHYDIPPDGAGRRRQRTETVKPESTERRHVGSLLKKQKSTPLNLG